MKKKLEPQMPLALLCGVLEDSGRYLFLKRKDRLGKETIELPCVLVLRGENQVASISSAFNTKTGIDGQIHEVIFESRFNFGSRKRKNWLPVLCFRVTAKNMSAHPSAEFSGFAWRTNEDARKERLGRDLEWFR